MKYSKKIKLLAVAGLFAGIAFQVHAEEVGDIGSYSENVPVMTASMKDGALNPLFPSAKPRSETVVTEGKNMKWLDGTVVTVPKGISVFDAQEVLGKTKDGGLLDKKTANEINAELKKVFTEEVKARKGTKTETKEDNALKAFADHKGPYINNLAFYELKKHGMSAGSVAYVLQMDVDKDLVQALLNVETNRNDTYSPENYIKAEKEIRPLSKEDIKKKIEEQILLSQQTWKASIETDPKVKAMMVKNPAAFVHLENYVKSVNVDLLAYSGLTIVEKGRSKIALESQRINLQIDGFYFPLGIYSWAKADPDRVVATLIFTPDVNYETWLPIVREMTGLPLKGGK